MTSFSYSQVRNDIYSYNRKAFLENGENMDDFASYPYTALKSRVYIEFSSVLVSALQYTKIQPNQLTILYAMLGPICIALFYTANEAAYLFGIFSFVLFKGVLDWSDGALARITGNCSSIGALLDPWGALVNSCSFQLCIGLYVYNMTNELMFVFLSMATVYFRVIDFRSYKLVSLGAGLIENPSFTNKPTVSEKENERTRAKGSKLYIPFMLATGILDDRARTVDTLLLIVLIELFLGNVYLSNLIVCLMTLGSFTKFCAGFYVTYANK